MQEHNKWHRNIVYRAQMEWEKDNAMGIMSSQTHFHIIPCTMKVDRNKNSDMYDKAKTIPRVYAHLYHKQFISSVENE